MDSKVLYEKDGMRFTKISDKKYNLQFVIENKNISPETMQLKAWEVKILEF